MPRKKKVPSYRRHASGQARVTINGRDYLLGLYGSQESRAKYAQKLAEWSDSDSRSLYGVPRKIVIAELLLAYLEFAKSYYGVGPSSDFHRIRQAVRPLRQLYADVEVDRFGPEQYKAVRKVFIENLRKAFEARPPRFTIRWAPARWVTMSWLLSIRHFACAASRVCVSLTHPSCRH